MRRFTDDQRTGVGRRVLLAGVFAAGLLTAGAGFLAGWATGVSSAASPTTAPAPTESVAVRGAGPGPTRVAAGVPEGFAHSADGAVRALIAMAQAQAGPLLLHPDRYRAAWREMCTSEYWASAGRAGAEQMLDALAVGGRLAANAARGQQVYVHLFPLTAGVTAYGDGRASLQLWSLVVVHSGDGATNAVFDGATAELRWTGTDWKLDGGRTFATSAGGSTGGFALTDGPALPPFLALPGVDDVAPNG